MKKDATVSDVHATTALGNEGKKKWKPFKDLVGQKPKKVPDPETPDADEVSKNLVGVRGRELEDFDPATDTLKVPFKYDPAAMSYVRPDQVPRFLDALTHQDRQELTTVNISDLIALQNRVNRKTVEKYLRKKNPDPPVIVRMNGALYIADGHDRMAAFWLKGDDAATVRYKDLQDFSNLMKLRSSSDSTRDSETNSTGNGEDTEKRGARSSEGDGLVDTRPIDPDADEQAAEGEYPDDQEDTPDPALLKVYRNASELPKAVTDRIKGKKRQRQWLSVWNSSFLRYKDESRAFADAWAATERAGGVGPGKTKKVADSKPEFSIPFKIEKADPDKRLMFGWASVATVGGEAVVDKQFDIIPVEELERAMYDFVLYSRDQGHMHEKRGVGRLVESMVFSKEKQDALGIDLGFEGAWVGFKVDDDQVWAAVKRGDLPQFSIGGAAIPVEIE